MSNQNAVLQATIEAYDAFKKQFQEFREELKRTEKQETSVKATTEQVNMALTAMVQAKEKARQASQTFNKVLQDVNSTEKHCKASTDQLAVAFDQMMAAERNAEKESQRLKQTLQSYNMTGKEAQAVIGQVERALAQSGQQHQHHGDMTHDNMMQTMALISAMYTLQRAMVDIMQTGRQFEVTIRQAQAVTGDFSKTLRDMAMESTGLQMDVHTPTELAQAYQQLGQMGATTNEIIASTPDILEFAINAMIETEDSAYGVTAALKSFNIPMSEAKTVTDAYTEAMNRGALAGKDFQWIMSSAGAVANMAGQDFQQILSVGSAMRDAGVQAQDAGTSIKAALMALMTPSDEATAVIDQLGLKIYDASGRMKQWADIVAEFERVLGPYNEQSRQMILGTIFGSDGIRAMATSLNKGSNYLQTFTEGLKSADGATHSMAVAMGQTFDGALRRTNASLERAKVLMFEDFAQAALPMLNVINTMIVGFNNLDDGTRRYLEVLVGAGGLVLAIKTTAEAMKMLGITMTFQTGILGIGIGALVAFTGALLYFNGEQARSFDLHIENAEASRAEIEKIQELQTEYETLTGKAKLTQEEQGRLKQVTQEITDLVPSAVTGFDQYGNALTNTKALAGAAADEVSRLTQEMQTQAQLAGSIAKAKMPLLEERYKSLKAEADVAAALINQGASGDKTAYEDFSSILGNKYTNWDMFMLKSGMTDDKSLALKKSEEIYSDFKEATEEYYKAKEALAAANAVNTYGPPKPPGGTTTTGGGGTKQWTPPDPNKDKKAADEARKKDVEATKRYVEALNNVLAPYEKAVDTAALAVERLAGKEQYLSQAMQSGFGTARQATELNRTRTLMLSQINYEQTKLNQLADQERAKLRDLAVQLKNATRPETAKVLREEMDKLADSIDQAGRKWWELENQELSMLQTLRQATQKRYDDAFSDAMNAMQHEVGLARMSTEQQISYLERLKNAHKWTQQQMWQIEDALYSARRQQLNEYMKEFEKAYKDQVDELEEEAKAAVKALQDQIDALDKEDQTADRENAEQDHLDKLKELQDQYNYHDQRTGKEHEKAKQDIQKQIDDENRQWLQQQEQWKRDDKRDSLQEQIEDTQEAYDEQKKDLQDHYEEAKELTEQGILDQIAVLMATSPEWYNAGKELIDQLIAGLESGDFTAVKETIDQVKEAAQGTGSDSSGGAGSGGGGAGLPSTIPIAELGPGQYTMVGNKATLWSQELAQLLGGLPVQWNAGTGTVSIGGKTFTPSRMWQGKSYVGIREVAEALGYGVGWNEGTKTVSIYKAYAKGGPVTETGPAIVHEGEYVIPRNLVDAVRRGTPPPSDPGWSNRQSQGDIDRLADRVVYAIERKAFVGGDMNFYGPLFHSENTYMGDEMTPYIAGRQLMKGAQTAKRRKGMSP